MNIDMLTLRDDFIQTGFAIVPNLFTRSEVQRLKLECIDILAAVKAETGAVAGHGVHVGLTSRSPVFQEAVGDERILDILAEILAPDIEFLSDKVVFKSEVNDLCKSVASGLALLARCTQILALGLHLTMLLSKTGVSSYIRGHINLPLCMMVTQAMGMDLGTVYVPMQWMKALLLQQNWKQGAQSFSMI